MKKVDQAESQGSEMQKLQEFIYKNTSEWATELQNLIEVESIKEEQGSEILFECIYLFLHLVNRISSTKLSDIKAKKLQDALRFFMALGIADLMFDDTEEDLKAKQREMLLKNIENAHIAYAQCKELLKKNDLATGTSLAAKLTHNLSRAMKMTDPADQKTIHDLVIKLTTDLFLNQMRQFELRVTRSGNELAIEV